MIQFVIAGAVVLGASTLAWHYNQKTDEEIDRQNKAYRDRDDIYSRYNSECSTNEDDYREQRRSQAKDYKELLLKEIEKHFEKVAPITKAYQELYDAITIEISAETTSPYRKSALRKEFSLIEDAQIRISEYAKYLEFERTKINQL